METLDAVSMWYVVELGERTRASRELAPILIGEDAAQRRAEMDRENLAAAFVRAVKICGLFAPLGTRAVDDGGRVRVYSLVRCEPAELQRLRIQYGRPLLVHGMAIPLPACDVAVGE